MRDWVDELNVSFRQLNEELRTFTVTATGSRL